MFGNNSDIVAPISIIARVLPEIYMNSNMHYRKINVVERLLFQNDFGITRL